MRCELHDREFSTKRALSIHRRWDEGRMSSENFMGINNGRKNGMWKEEPGMTSLHEWVKKRLIKPNICDACSEIKPLDLANISQEYKRELSDWEWLCRKCHMIKDGRLRRLHLNKQKDKVQIICIYCKRDFLVVPSRKNKAKYCSVICKSLAFRQPSHWKHLLI